MNQTIRWRNNQPVKYKQVTLINAMGQSFCPDTVSAHDELQSSLRFAPHLTRIAALPSIYNDDNLTIDIHRDFPQSWPELDKDGYISLG